MSRKRFRKPLGALTNNAESYVSAWRRLAAPLMQVLGYKLLAFDPDIALVRPNQSVTFVSVDVARAFYKLATKEEYFDDARRTKEKKT